MGNYKLSKFKDDVRTDAYVFTVESKHDKDLLSLKENIKRSNKHKREYIREVAEKWGKDKALDYMKHYQLKRITLMSRGPRTVPAVNDGYHPRTYDQSLPHQHATHFDVYLHTDSSGQYNFRDQIENNITPGEQARINKLKHQMWDIEQQIRNIKFKRNNI